MVNHLQPQLALGRSFLRCLAFSLVALISATMPGCAHGDAVDNTIGSENTDSKAANKTTTFPTIRAGTAPKAPLSKLPDSHNSPYPNTSQSEDGDGLNHGHPQPSLSEQAETPATNRLEAALDEPTTPPRGSEISSPKPGTLWQWQPSEEIDTSNEVDVYNIDLFDTPTATIKALQDQGRAVICYFSAGTWEDWRPDASQFEQSLLGQSNGSPGERWLDIGNIDELQPLIEARLDLAVAKGCDAVEPDNVDAYQNDTGFLLTPSDQIVYNSLLANAAHARGLSVGLKNTVELIGVLEPLFDWALNEECMRYDECASYAKFIDADKAVFHVEYQGGRAYCHEARAIGLSSLEKSLDITATYLPC